MLRITTSAETRLIALKHELHKRAEGRVAGYDRLIALHRSQLVALLKRLDPHQNVLDTATKGEVIGLILERYFPISILQQDIRALELQLTPVRV